MIFEAEDRLATLLRTTAEQAAWRLRELRRPEAVLDVLGEGSPVLVIRLGRDLFEELALLEQVQWSYPETAVVIVSNVEHPELTTLLWELGATAVLQPSDALGELPELVTSLMNAAD
jgi:hypothetical protein